MDPSCWRWDTHVRQGISLLHQDACPEDLQRALGWCLMLLSPENGCLSPDTWRYKTSDPPAECSPLS